MGGARITADVCLILEGTYPYVTGGVSSWTHDLILAQKDLSFHLVTLLAKNANLSLRYKVPKNVVDMSRIVVQVLPAGGFVGHAKRLFAQLQPPLMRLQSGGGLEDVVEILRILGPYRTRLGRDVLLNSQAAWDMLLRMYQAGFAGSSFLDYFWSWRALLSGMYSIFLADLPPARLYHAISTGYAGLLAARAHVETGRPALVTEHGVYTNERRIEMAMADWLHDAPRESLQIETAQRTPKDIWVETFIGYSRACYEACSEIITLYAGNQQFQLQDGAPADRLKIIPNGIDFERYSAIRRDPELRPPTVALIGRVVPIKDVKSFVRASSILRAKIPDLRALVLGPTDEDRAYFEDCQKLVNHLGLQEIVTFKGRVRLEDYLGKVDAVVLTSISEAQPLVILEAGAAGLPIVATDVGACREMVLGDEEPALGPGGAITPLCNPAATAEALLKLLTNKEWHMTCSRALQERVRRHYNKAIIDRTYGELYGKYRMAPVRQWPELVSNYAS